MGVLALDGVVPNGKVYNGRARKFGVTLDGVDYLVKFPVGNDLSVYSEYVASQFIDMLGVPCHQVMLGQYQGSVVAVIRDFVAGTGYSLKTFDDIRRCCVDVEQGLVRYTYTDVLNLVDGRLRMSVQDKGMSKCLFWQMYICDAILGNSDRHGGNWGYLVPCGRWSRYKAAPIYDNASSLFPDVGKEILEYCNQGSRKGFLRYRVYDTPVSSLRVERGGRLHHSSYVDVLRKPSKDGVFFRELKRVRQGISYQAVFNMMSVICGSLPIGVEYRRFYIEVVALRFMCLVLGMDFDDAYGTVERMMGYAGW